MGEAADGGLTRPDGLHTLVAFSLGLPARVRQNHGADGRDQPFV